MTREVAVMNKRGIALAADSAVALGDSGKVYRTAEKLFPLAPSIPVAIMIFGNAYIMGIPWETVVKIYTHKLTGRRFDTLEEDAHDFLSFIEASARRVGDRGWMTFATVSARAWPASWRLARIVLPTRREANPKRVGKIERRVISKILKRLTRTFFSYFTVAGFSLLHQVANAVIRRAWFHPNKARAPHERFHDNLRLAPTFLWIDGFAAL